MNTSYLRCGRAQATHNIAGTAKRCGDG